MSSIWAIAKKEFKSAFKEQTFVIITIIFLVLSILSVYIGATTKGTEIKVYNDIVQMLKSQGSNFLPPKPEIYPLSILQNIITYVSIIGSMLAIFLGFDAISSEKENGTLRLLLSKPLYRDQLITGKLLGGALVIGTVLIITLIFNVILFIAIGNLVPNLNELFRLISFILIGFLYMMLFYSITLYVSLKSNNRSFGVLIMLLIWVSLTYVIPQLAETQKAFAYALNSTAQTVTQIPTDTVISKTISLFSPSMQFEYIGKDLLQVIPETAKMNIFSILLKNISSALLIIIPGISILFLTFRSFLREDV